MCPIYEFECPECSKVFEKICSISSNTRKVKCVCGKQASKIVSKCDFYLKGGGWEADSYVTNKEKFSANLKAVDTY